MATAPRSDTCLWWLRAGLPESYVGAWDAVFVRVAALMVVCPQPALRLPGTSPAQGAPEPASEPVAA
ncbi:hypothetical protein [Streptomyces sp. NPDC003480]